MRKEPGSSPGLDARDTEQRGVVAVDANGADLGPAEVAAGAALAAERGVRTILFGPAAGHLALVLRLRERNRLGEAAGVDQRGKLSGDRLVLAVITRLRLLAFFHANIGFFGKTLTSRSHFVPP